VRIVQIYPNLLGTYGDAGNALVLRRRLVVRSVPCELVTVDPGRPVPREGDVYLLGGGEDAKQTAAARALAEDGALASAVERGGVVMGICAGYQLLGTTFLGVGGRPTAGLGLLDVTTDRLERRAVGNILAGGLPLPGVRGEPDGVVLPDLIGFENHGGATRLGPGASPLGRVRIGVGNGADAAGANGDHRHAVRSEGAVQGRVYGTYLHGPVLALNPALADRLLAHVTGPLADLDDALVEAFRRHRLEVVLPATLRATHRRSILSRLRGHDSAPSGASARLSGAPPV
jgi:CobQ-like glutamine amidotransferase family enzyme